MRLLASFVALLSVATSGIAECQSVKTYPVPQGVPVATSFELNVRAPGGEWKSVDLHRPTLHEINQTTGGAIVHQSALASFDFVGTVEISATYAKAAVAKARILPASLGIEPEIDAPEEDDESVIYFGPGYHQVSEQIKLKSGQTLFLDGGAVVTSPGVLVANATNVAIRGRGVFYSPPPGVAIAIERSTDVVIEGGLIGINTGPRTYNSERVTIRNWRGFSGVQWGDGLDFFCSQDIFVDRAFLRNSDDCVAVYSHRDQWYGDTRNITVKNSILWADVAHPFNVGTHGNTANPETIDGITIQNIDVLDHREMQVSYQGVIALNAGDSNMIQNVLIDDVRVDDFRQGQLLNFRIMYNDKYNTSPGRGIRDVVIRDLVYDGQHAATSIFVGYNETRGIENVRFENLKINGKVISDTMRKPGWYLTSDYVPMFVNEHVHNLTFVST